MSELWPVVENGCEGKSNAQSRPEDQNPSFGTDQISHFTIYASRITHHASGLCPFLGFLLASFVVLAVLLVYGKRVRPEVCLALGKWASVITIHTFSLSFPASVDRNTVSSGILKPCKSC